MNTLNYKFFDEFKQLDKLCRDIYGKTSDNRLGVSSYIDDMEANSYRGERLVLGWREDYKRLKNVRHKRNELAHDQVSFSDNVCTQDDVDFVRSFRERILMHTDPLSLLRKQTQKTYSTPRKYSNTTSMYQSTVHHARSHLNENASRSSAGCLGCLLPVICISGLSALILSIVTFLVLAIA